MATRLPPLNALRAFEAAARRGGFTGAARELNVTPAAVSHQVKALESHLEVRLFRRLPRGLEITEAGRELLPQITRGFDHFERAIGSLRGGGLAGPLTVSAIPSFATLWLLPRLGGFLRAYPEVEVRVLGRLVPPDLDRGEADVRIPYGLGSYPGFDTRPLMRERIFPVCAPTVLNHAPLRRFADLRRHTLLHDIHPGDDEPRMTWEHWLSDEGVTGVDAARGVKLSDAVLVIAAAVHGQGIALGRESLVGDHLAAGRLVRPLPVSHAADYAYYTVTTHAGASRPRIRAFRDWIEAEVEREPRHD